LSAVDAARRPSPNRCWRSRSGSRWSASTASGAPRCMMRAASRSWCGIPARSCWRWTTRIGAAVGTTASSPSRPANGSPRQVSVRSW